MARDSNLAAWRWPVVFIVLFVGILYTANRWMDHAVKSLAPSYSNSTIIQTSVSRLHQQAKFVVLSADINVEVTRSSAKILWDVLDFGDTVATIRTRGNKAQYFVSLEKIGEDDFHFSNDNRNLTVTVPHPRVDEEIVEVQSDPNQIEIETKVGWGRMDKRSGELARAEAKRGLRDAILAEAKSQSYIDLARKNAREKIGGLLTPLVSQMGVTNVTIEFRKP
jgi:hypothetical protein